MSNLGAYQWITTMSKKVGGPQKFIGIVAIGGYVVIRSAEAGFKCALKSRKKEENGTVKKLTSGDRYKVVVEGTSNEGVNFNIDDEFCILEVDGEVVLVDKIEDPDSPYYISKEFFNKIIGERQEKEK